MAKVKLVLEDVVGEDGEDELDMNIEFDQVDEELVAGGKLTLAQKVVTLIANQLDEEWEEFKKIIADSFFQVEKQVNCDEEKEGVGKEKETDLTLN